MKALVNLKTGLVVAIDRDGRGKPQELPELPGTVIVDAPEDTRGGEAFKDGVVLSVAVKAATERLESSPGVLEEAERILGSENPDIAAAARSIIQAARKERDRIMSDVRAEKKQSEARLKAWQDRLELWESRLSRKELGLG